MQVAIIGANGQLGSELTKFFPDCIALTHQDLDIENKAAVEEFFKNNKIDIIINTAAYHDMNKTETDPLKAFSVNSLAVKHLADECLKHHATLIHISTDYVFDGKKNEPYTEEDTPNPLNWYGLSKAVGERIIRNHLPNHYIIRSSGVFGHTGCRAKGGGNFVETMIKKLAAGTDFTVVTDQTVSPTYAYDAAVAIKQLLEKKVPYGTYHLTNSGSCSWHEFASAIAQQTNSSTKILPGTSTASPIKRPDYSVLNNQKIKNHGIPMPTWQEALSHYLSNRPSPK
ncbi:MAG: dTDP-4-dehydrorhamnose reductase [Candidatus Nanoarchaeia archaeon]